MWWHTRVPFVRAGIWHQAYLHTWGASKRTLHPLCEDYLEDLLYACVGNAQTTITCLGCIATQAHGRTCE